MPNFEDEKIDMITHHIGTISKEMQEVKKAILKEKEEQETLAKKDKKKRNSLKKAQKKFKNVSTNFKMDEFEKIEKRLKELDMNASSYIKELVALDLEKHLLVK